MSTVNLTGLRLELAKAEAAKQRAREDELKTLHAETERLREQIKLIANHVNFLRDCMMKQAGINDKIVDHGNNLHDCMMRQAVINDKIVDILERRTSS